MKKFILNTSLIIPIVLVLAACGTILDLSNINSNAEPYGIEGILDTMTARAIQGGSDSEVATAYAKSTAISQEKTARALLEQSNWQATATAGAPILLELPKYDVDPQRGWVSWVHNPVTLELTKYQEYQYANNFPEITGKDFVLATDITWNTDYGSSGCGFVFRSNGERDEPNQYTVMITRFAEGSLAFNAMRDGAMVNTKSYFPAAYDETFRWENDATNRLVVVARQEILTFYTNGTKIGEIDILNPPPDSIPQANIPTEPPNMSEAQRLEYQRQLDQYNQTYGILQGDLITAQNNYYQYEPAHYYDGFLSLLAFSQSGHTECKFENTWLFTIDTPPTATPNLTWTATITPTPTKTLVPTKTLTPSRTPRDSATPTRTATITPTVPTLTPSNTTTPPQSSDTPPPTYTPPQPSDTPPPTYTPPQPSDTPPTEPATG